MGQPVVARQSCTECIFDLAVSPLYYAIKLRMVSCGEVVAYTQAAHQHRLVLAGHLAVLAILAIPAPTGNVGSHAFPYPAGGDEVPGGLYALVGKVMWTAVKAARR